MTPLAASNMTMSALDVAKLRAPGGAGDKSECDRTQRRAEL